MMKLRQKVHQLQQKSTSPLLDRASVFNQKRTRQNHRDGDTNHCTWIPVRRMQLQAFMRLSAVATPSSRESRTRTQRTFMKPSNVWKLRSWRFCCMIRLDSELRSVLLDATRCQNKHQWRKQWGNRWLHLTEESTSLACFGQHLRES